MKRGIFIDILHSTYIKRDTETVFKTLTSSDGWNAWFTDDTMIHFNSNGSGHIRLRWINYGVQKLNIEDGGDILEAIPNKSFVFQWSPIKEKTTVAFKLHPYKDGTLVTLKESSYPINEESFKACLGCAVGWGEALTLLKVYLECGIVLKEDLL
ncbi:MAG: SRPBCC family protein [Tuberibacillus sp.]